MIGIVAFVLLVLFQTQVLNNIHFFRIATPFIYLYFILKLPLETSPSKVILISFVLGLTIDALSNTPGMHTTASTLIGFLRLWVIQLYIGKHNLVNGISPSFKTFGVGTFVKYITTLVLIHHITLFVLESFSLFDPLFLGLRILTSSVMTLVFLCIVESFTTIESKKSAT